MAYAALQVIGNGRRGELERVEVPPSRRGGEGLPPPRPHEGLECLRGRLELRGHVPLGLIVLLPPVVSPPPPSPAPVGGGLPAPSVRKVLGIPVARFFGCGAPIISCCRSSGSALGRKPPPPPAPPPPPWNLGGAWRSGGGGAFPPLPPLHLSGEPRIPSGAGGRTKTR